MTKIFEAIEVDDPGFSVLGIVRAGEMEKFRRDDQAFETRKAELERLIAAQDATIDERIKEAIKEGHAAGLDKFLTAVEEVNGIADEVSRALHEKLEFCLTELLRRLDLGELITSEIQKICEEQIEVTSLELRVNPENVASLEKALDEVNLRVSASLVVVGDTSLSLDECLFYSNNDVFNLSIPILVESLIERLETAPDEVVQE